jgi:undecaprenyl pyrophosphate phosphatase UppP
LSKFRFDSKNKGFKMYDVLLSFHSVLRWFVLIPLVLIVLKSWAGWLSGSKFSKFDKILQSSSVGFIHLQLILGLILYFISPIVQSLFENFGEMVKNKDIRYFAMEHTLMMIIAVVLATIGSAKAKKKLVDKDKFRVLAIWLTLVLLIIFIMIPWEFISFNPSRPMFRGF